jgi:Xaa-Pro aminopeptidase
MSEARRKIIRIRAFMEDMKIHYLLFNRVSSFAWATCGIASYVNRATSMGEASLLVTPSNQHLITNNIEAARLEQEDTLVEQGWEIHTTPWYKTSETIKGLVGKGRIGADVPYPGAIDLSLEISRLRADLTPEEGDRYQKLGRLCAEAMHRATQKIQPGQTEYQIAGVLAQEVESSGIQAIVNLVATDERIFQYRHPLPTDKNLDRYAMLVLCGRRWGLVCSITRFVHFGSLAKDLRSKSEAVAKVDATFIDATRPGSRLGDVFKKAMEVYEETGFPDEWQQHHQGGPTGYEPREHIAAPSSRYQVREGQVFAWNPSITGTKSEDTILIGERKNEVLTLIDGWPTLTVGVNNKTYERPAIMEIT